MRQSFDLTRSFITSLNRLTYTIVSPSDETRGSEAHSSSNTSIGSNDSEPSSAIRLDQRETKKDKTKKAAKIFADLVKSIE